MTSMTSQQGGKVRPSEATTDADQPQRGRKHIFCINASADHLSLLRDVLQDEHYHVTTSNFVPNSCDQIAALQPDLIIVDLAVTTEADWDLLERLQQDAATNAIPVLVMSTDQRLLDRAAAQQHRYGAERFVGKPFDIDDLLSMVESIIGKA